jgi:hypothetical protein
MSKERIFYCMLSTVAQDPSSFGCPLNCEHSNYVASVFYHDVNVINNLEGYAKGVMLVYLLYDSTIVQKSEEMLLYDTPALLSAVGGSLGLFLGFSCITVFFYAIDNWHCIMRKINTRAAR